MAATSGFPETEIRRQLDRLFFTEQYILDIKKTDKEGSNKGDPLPGLAFIGGGGPINSGSAGNSAPSGQMTYDVLLVLDSSISEVRRGIANEIIKRQLEAAKIDKVSKVEVRRQTMLKVAPPDLAPLSPKGQSNPDGKNPEKGPKQPDTPQPPDKKPEQTLYDFIENKRDLATKSFIALWSAIASLLVLLGLMTRLSDRKGDKKSIPQSPAQGSQQGGRSADGSGDGNKSSGDKGGGGRAQLTRDELFSKDAALFKQIQEIVEEANATPLKVAHILSRWLENSDEYARYASVFLKNCDIRTTENVCKHLHPSDIEKLVHRSVTDFEPFSEENRRVLELMRSDLAIMAARQNIKEKTSPLPFLKTLSDDDLARILEKESIKDIAIIATQVPAHRLSKFLETTSEANYKELMRVVAGLGDLVPEDFSSIKSRLEDKILQFSDIVVSKEHRITAMKQLLSAAKNPVIQQDMAKDIYLNHKAIYLEIRQTVFLLQDLLNLPSRAAKVFFQSIDGAVLANALSGVKFDQGQLLSSLPEAVRESFIQAQTAQEVQSGAVDPKVRMSSWSKVIDTIDDLRNNGLIAANEIRQAQIKTDSQYDLAGEDSSSPPAQTLGNTRNAA